MMGDENRFDAMDAEFWARQARMPGSTPAAVCDAILGSDSPLADERAIAATHPSAPLVAMTSRAFLRRAVHALVDLGIRQFLNLGSDLPTVHAAAGQAAPDARIIHVNNDQDTVERGRAMLEGNPRATIIPGDLRQPVRILRRLRDPRLTRLVDLELPTALLLVEVTHFLQPADHPDNVVAVYRSALAAGSYLVLSHLASESFPAEDLARLQDLHRTMGSPPPRPRRRHEVQRFFAGLDVMDPGVVFAPQWRPEEAHDQDPPWPFPTDAPLSGTYVGVGYKTNGLSG